MKEPDITLEEWDQLNHSKTHSKGTLLAWTRDGKIQPQPEKRGRTYWVRPDAKYIEPDKARINRLRQAARMLEDSTPVTNPSARVLEIFSHGSTAAETQIHNHA